MPLVSTSAAGLTDIVLIYQGGIHRPVWTPNQFEPYVSARDGKKVEQWLFDGFLFIEFSDHRGHDYAAGYGHQPGRQEDWLWLLERNFATNAGIAALDEAIGVAAARLGTPSRPRKVILTLPEPIPSLTNWGAVDGRALNFTRTEDRIAACRWHIETALAKWQALHPKHLQLAGFYWVAEHSAKDNEILPRIAEVIHEHRLRFFWIPYWQASGAANWAHLGFDAVYQQPNHFFHPEVKDSRLDEACAFARSNQMGLEFECDARAAQLPEKFRSRLYSYLQSFTVQGVKERAAMAYYEGGGTLMDWAKSDDPACRADYQAIADWVIGRQLKASQAQARAP